MGKGNMGKVVSKVFAPIARRIANEGAKGRCWGLMHQPKEPQNLRQRLESLNNK